MEVTPVVVRQDPYRDQYGMPWTADRMGGHSPRLIGASGLPPTYESRALSSPEEGSEMTTGEPNSTGENTPPTTIAPPAQPQSQPQSQPAQPVDLSPLLTTIAALPEQIAKSVREAVGQPKVQTATAKTDEKPAEKVVEKPAATAAPTGGTPGRKSFRQWWFD